MSSSESKAHCPKRHAGANQDEWIRRSKSVVNDISSSLSLFSSFSDLFLRLCGHRERVALALDPPLQGWKYRDPRTACMGRSLLNGECGVEAVYEASTLWGHLAPALIDRAVRCLKMPVELIRCYTYSYENPKLSSACNFSVQIQYKHKFGVETYDSASMNLLANDSGDYVRFDYKYAKVDHRLSDRISWLYLCDCLNAGSQSVLLQSLGRLMHYMCIHLRVMAGNAAMAQWIGTAILKYHGYETDFLVENGFPRASDGLPFDWVALVTPDVTSYIAEFSVLFENVISRYDLDRSLTFKGTDTALKEIECYSEVPPTMLDCAPDWVKAPGSGFTSEQFWSLPRYIRHALAHVSPHVQKLIDNHVISGENLNWFIGEGFYESLFIQKYQGITGFFKLMSELLITPAGNKALQVYMEGLTPEGKQMVVKYPTCLSALLVKLGSVDEMFEVVTIGFCEKIELMSQGHDYYEDDPGMFIKKTMLPLGLIKMLTHEFAKAYNTNWHYPSHPWDALMVGLYRELHEYSRRCEDVFRHLDGSFNLYAINKGLAVLIKNGYLLSSLNGLDARVFLKLCERAGIQGVDVKPMASLGVSDFSCLDISEQLIVVGQIAYYPVQSAKRVSSVGACAGIRHSVKGGGLSGAAAGAGGPLRKPEVGAGAGLAAGMPTPESALVVRDAASTGEEVKVNAPGLWPKCLIS